MASDEDAAAGLIHWVNSLGVGESLSTTDELATGSVLWKLLQLVDSIAFPGRLPEDTSRLDTNSPQSWIPKWTNLKHVYDALSIFLIEECNQHLPIFSNSQGHKVNPDLKAIAQHGSLADAIIVLKLCVVAATNCDNRLSFLEGMQDLPEAVQRILMETLQESQINAEERELEDDDVSEDREEDDLHYTQEPQQTGLNSSSAIVPSSDLAFEERLAKVIADSQRIAHEKRELQRVIDELNARHESLQERYDRSQEELTEANDRLSAVLSGRTGGIEKTSDAQKEAVIANLESRVAEYETDIESLRKSNEVFKIKAEKVQKLQDDYDEIKIERDSLARKANTAEKYRQKLEASHDMEKENNNLKQKIADLQVQVRQSDSRTASSSDLNREIEEYRRLLPAIEQERHEVNEMKKRLEFDYQVLSARYGDSEEQLRRSRQEVEDLQGRLREYDDTLEPRPRASDISEVQDEESNVETMIENDEEAFAAAEARLTQALLKANNSGIATSGEGGEFEDGISEDELRAIMAAMRAQMHAGTVQERESGLKMQKKMVIMLEKARSKNVDLIDHVRKQSELIAELQQRPEPEPQPEKPTREPMSDSDMEQQLEDQDILIENLKREIRLISSAWYEQNQRLATLGAGSGGGAVALMRLKGGAGLEEPKSFLGRQRRMAERATLGTGVKAMR